MVVDKLACDGVESCITDNRKRYFFLKPKLNDSPPMVRGETCNRSAMFWVEKWSSIVVLLVAPQQWGPVVVLSYVDGDDHQQFAEQLEVH